MNPKKCRSLGIILFAAIAAVIWMIQFGTTGVNAAGSDEAATAKTGGQTPAATPAHQARDSAPFYGIAVKETLSSKGTLSAKEDLSPKANVPPKRKRLWQETYKPRNAGRSAGGKGKAVTDKRGESEKPRGSGGNSFVSARQRGESVEKVRIVIDANSMVISGPGINIPHPPSGEGK